MNKIIIILGILILVLTACNPVPKACSSEFDFSSARISNDNMLPESQYVAKNQDSLFFSDVAGNGEGQIEIKIDIVQKQITKSYYFQGEKETETYQKGDEDYSVILDEIKNLSEKYLKEAMIVNGYEKENQVVIEQYTSCIKKLD
ncbi:hypothetical protein H8D36_02935 [archaeon]|nr:hypothetical protein [archaeon]MBL7057489.1 hypothetical protein [Candidatus Woesearchaeota archaeon]